MAIPTTRTAYFAHFIIGLSLFVKKNSALALHAPAQWIIDKREPLTGLSFSVCVTLNFFLINLNIK